MVSFYGPEKSKQAKLVLAACTDGISKGAHGLALNSIIKRKKKKNKTLTDLDLTRQALKLNTTHCINYGAERGKGRSWMPNSSSQIREGRVLLLWKGFVIPTALHGMMG